MAKKYSYDEPSPTCDQTIIILISIFVRENSHRQSELSWAKPKTPINDLQQSPIDQSDVHRGESERACVSSSIHQSLCIANESGWDEDWISKIRRNNYCAMAIKMCNSLSPFLAQLNNFTPLCPSMTNNHLTWWHVGISGSGNKNNTANRLSHVLWVAVFLAVIWVAGNSFCIADRSGFTWLAQIISDIEHDWKNNIIVECCRVVQSEIIKRRTA